jgi:hypothetical protein
MVVLLAANDRAAAQEATFEGAGDLPPAMDLPSGEELFDGQTLEPEPEPIEGSLEEGFASPYSGSPMEWMAACPSLFESSGTWLRRGFWYAEGDYMLLNRGWDRKGLMLAFEGSPGLSTAPGIGFAGPNLGTVLALNPLVIEGSKPGADGLARVTLGRLLFRDERNRDHTAEVTYFGGGEWSQANSIEAATDAGIQIIDFVDRVNPSFDGADSMGFAYDTRMNSIEGNYLVKQRMARDQMVLQPNGDWVRAAQSSHTVSFLAGLRYLNLNEALDINATNINVGTDQNPDNQDGFYAIRTDNDLFGTQLGAAATYETARWSVGVHVKGGSFWNRMDLDSNFRVGETTVINSGVTRSTEDNLAFVGEFQVRGKWHLRPNLSLRAGFEILYVDSIALAPHQINFIPGGYESIAADGDIFAIGSSVGIEAYR